ncbi:MAG: metal-sensitive transcriptional regulator [Lysinibacillus sp.]
MKYDVKIENRLKRIDGQIQGVLRMMKEEKDCKDVVTQLSAIRSAVDRTIGVIVSDNLVECMKESASEEEQSKIVQEAINLVVKSR